MSSRFIFYDENNNEETHVIDADPVRQLNRTATLTDNPIEDGSNTQDHIVIDPYTFSISNAVMSANKRFTDDDSNRMAKFRERLEKAFLSGEEVTIETPSRIYEKVGITSLSQEENSKSGKSYRFNITFKQINKKETKTVKLTLIGKGTTAQKKKDQDRYGGKKDKGQQSGKETTEEQNKKISSWLAQGLDKLKEAAN